MTETLYAKPPSILWTLSEPRAVFEFGAFQALMPLMERLPQGDGHPVLVLPGFLAGDRSTGPMRGLLKKLGYYAHGWKLGRNDQFNLVREQAMFDRLEEVYENSGGQKVTIIGWSLGGVFARELAKMFPDYVRQVISLGSPLTNDRNWSAATPAFERRNGRRTQPEREGRYKRLADAPPVPFTSIFTKTDGIVNWPASVQRGQRSDVENIVVPASHIGLGVNPIVMAVLADRLAQPEGEWAPFEPKGWQRFVTRPHSAY